LPIWPSITICLAISVLLLDKKVIFRDDTGMIVGYARVSTDDQTFVLQSRELLLLPLSSPVQGQAD